MGELAGQGEQDPDVTLPVATIKVMMLDAMVLNRPNAVP